MLPITKNIKKLNKKRTITLFFLAFNVVLMGFVPFLTDAPLNEPIQTITNNESEPPEIPYQAPKTSAYSNNFTNTTSTGLGVSLHQSYLNESFNTCLNASDSNNNTFTMPAPTKSFNATFVNVTIEDIYAPNKTLVIEDENSNAEAFTSQRLAGGFKLFSEGILYNLSANIYRPIDSNRDMRVRLFNSTWNGVWNVPDSYLKTLVTTDTTSTFLNDWYIFTFDSGNKFNNIDPANTANNTFYIELYDSGDFDVEWYYDKDIADGSDDMNTFYWTGSAWENFTQQNDLTDFNMKIWIAPLNNTPFPSQINFKINNTAVINVTNGSGHWTSESKYSDSPNNLTFEISADWWDVTCNITSVQVNYTKLGLTATSIFNTSVKDQKVRWNVSVNQEIDFFDSDFEYHSINFTIPSNWMMTEIKACNGTSDFSVDTSAPSINGYLNATVYGATNGTNWYLLGNSTNLLQSIDIFVKGTSDLITNASKSFDVQFNASFNALISQNDGNINLSIYNPDNYYNLLNHTSLTTSFSAGKNLTLSDYWDVNDTVTMEVTENLEFRIQIFWHNDTAVGYLETNFTITDEIETELKDLETAFSVKRGDCLNYTFNYTRKSSGSHISVASISEEDALPAGFKYQFFEKTDNYTLQVNTTLVTARKEPYKLNFSVYKICYQPRLFNLSIQVLLPDTSLVNLTDNIVGDVIAVGVNLTLCFLLNDTVHNSFIMTLTTNNITVKEGNSIWYKDDANFPNGGYILKHDGNGNYTLVISTLSLTRENRYDLTVNISYTSSNPGPYNDTIQLVSFYYGSKPSTSNGDDNTGGGGSTPAPTPPAPIIQEGITFEELLPYLLLIGILVGAVAGSIGAYRGLVVPKKREKALALAEVNTMFDDAINLEHVLVLYKGTGMCIFFKSFGSEEIDPELISGFLSAVSSFGREMESQEALNEINYGDKMLLLSDGEYVRVALVLNKKPSTILNEHLKEFIEAFERIYENDLPNWRGQLNLFRNAGEIVNEKLNTSIILPHEITYSFTDAKSLKSSYSKTVLTIANNLLKDSNRNFFFIATLLTEATEQTNKGKEEIFMGIKELRDKKILMPIEIAAIEEQPISQQEFDLINHKVRELTNLSPEETQKFVKELSQMGAAEREACLASLAEQHEIVSAPVKSKAGALLINDAKSAKKEIRNFKKRAKELIKENEIQKAIEIYENATIIAKSWELVELFEELKETIRIITIDDLKKKAINLEKEAKIALKAEVYGEAAQKYKEAAKISSEIFKLGVTEMTKEVKRLINKSKECEKLG